MERVVVVGGGPAGAVAALVLARRGVAVTLLEARRAPTARPGECLPPSVTPLLQRLGLEPSLAADGHGRSLGNRFVWGDAAPAERIFLAGTRGDGWHLDRRLFEARLAAHAVAAGVDWRWGARVVRCVRGDGGGEPGSCALGSDERGGGELDSDKHGGAKLGGGCGGAKRGGELGSGKHGGELDSGKIGGERGSGKRGGELGSGKRGEHDGRAAAGRRWRLDVAGDAGRQQIEAALVADATGRRARLARGLGARRRRYDRLVGVSVLLASATPAVDSYTLVEATPDGWWYTAVLGDGRLAAALFGDGDLLPQALLHPASAADEWWRRLAATAATRERIAGHGYREVAAPFQAAPAESSRLDFITGDGWLALGDAAAAYDPLSSHGIGSAMGSGFYGGHAAADLLAGRDEAQWAYVDVMQSTYGAYLDLLRRCYADERRWPDAPFWRRRHDAGYCLEPLAAFSAGRRAGCV